MPLEAAPAPPLLLIGAEHCLTLHLPLSRVDEAVEVIERARTASRSGLGPLAAGMRCERLDGGVRVTPYGQWRYGGKRPQDAPDGASLWATVAHWRTALLSWRAWHPQVEPATCGDLAAQLARPRR